MSLPPPEKRFAAYTAERAEWLPIKGKHDRETCEICNWRPDREKRS